VFGRLDFKWITLIFMLAAYLAPALMLTLSGEEIGLYARTVFAFDFRNGMSGYEWLAVLWAVQVAFMFISTFLKHFNDAVESWGTIDPFNWRARSCLSSVVGYTVLGVALRVAAFYLDMGRLEVPVRLLSLTFTLWFLGGLSAASQLGRLVGGDVGVPLMLFLCVLAPVTAPFLAKKTYPILAPKLRRLSARTWKKERNVNYATGQRIRSVEEYVQMAIASSDPRITFKSLSRDMKVAKRVGDKRRYKKMAKAIEILERDYPHLLLKSPPVWVRDERSIAKDKQPAHAGKEVQVEAPKKPHYAVSLNKTVEELVGEWRRYQEEFEERLLRSLQTAKDRDDIQAEEKFRTVYERIQEMKKSRVSTRVRVTFSERASREEHEGSKSYCETPVAFQVFGSCDPQIAMTEANKRGLVAIFLRKRPRKYNLLVDSQEIYDFLAIPKELAERLIWGEPVKPNTSQERRALEMLRQRSMLTCHNMENDGSTRYYKLKNEKLRRKMADQIYSGTRRRLWELIACEKLFEGVVGLEDAKEAIIWEFLVPLYFPEKCGAKPVSGLLLYGPHGTGKTELVKAIAENLKVPFKEVKPSNIFVGSHDDCIQAIKKIFEWARKQEKGAILFFDEVDGLFARRHLGDMGWDKEVLAELLSQADGLVENRKVLLIACTNKPWALDEAAMRPGRFSRPIPLWQEPRGAHRLRQACGAD